MELTQIFGFYKEIRHSQIGTTKMTNLLTSNEIGCATNTVIKKCNNTTTKTPLIANKRTY